MAVTLVTRDDARLVSDIEKLIKKKLEIEPIELEDLYPRRTRRPRDDDAGEAREPARDLPMRRLSVPAGDPFFDKPYEAPAADAPPTWETPGGAAPVRSTVSANIKTKRKVAALFKTTA